MVIQRITNFLGYKKIPALMLVIFLASFALFYPSLNYYFFQDDWFVLNWVRTANFWDLLKFRTDIIYWRPLSMPLLFALSKSLFGLNALYFHLFSMALFFGLVATVYKLFKLLFENTRLALVCTFLYAIWPIHFISLSWFSTTAYIVSPLLQGLSFIFFINFYKKKKLYWYFLSIFFFMSALASSEMALVLPVILFFWGYLLKRKNYLIQLLPFFLIDTAYLATRFLIYPVPAYGDYEIFLNRQIIYNFIWYTAWSLGLPEAFKSLIFPSLPQQSLRILVQFWKISLPFLVIAFFLGKIIFSYLYKKRNILLFGIIWYVVGIAPVLPLIKHSYPMYLSFAGLGLLFIIGGFLNERKIYLTLSFLILWTIVSIFNLEFTRHTHWIKNLQAISKAYVVNVKDLISNPQKNSVFIFKDSTIEFATRHNFVLVETEDSLRLALNDQDALQVIYNDSTLKSIHKTGSQNILLRNHVYEVFPH